MTPDTGLERATTQHGVDLRGHLVRPAGDMDVARRVGNLLLYLLALWRPPRWLFDLVSSVPAGRTARGQWLAGVVGLPARLPVIGLD